MVEKKEEYVVYKYEVPVVDGIFEIYMPTPIEPLHFGLQRGEPYLWAEVDKFGVQEPVKFFIVGTGHPFPVLGKDENEEYIGTVVGYLGHLVFHLYTVVEWAELDLIEDE